ncbi:MAG: Wzz/FepE/Etk N-terminal domain-containing protein, partial [Tsuneonella sp.]
MNNVVNYPGEMGLTMADEPVASGPIATDARDNPAVREYLAILLRRRWVILAIVVLAMLIGLAVTMLATPQYTAASRIEISRQQQRITNVEGVDQTDRTYDQEFYETQYELLKARSVAERVARKLRLAGNLDFFAAHGVDTDGAPFLASTNRTPTRQEQDRRQAAAVDLLLGHIGIAPVARSSIVDITYTSAS